MLHLYYLDLAEFTSAIVFLVVFKVVLLLLMNRMSKVFAEESEREPVKEKKRLKPELNWLRISLGLILLCAGLWQVRPVMLTVSSVRLSAVGTTGWFANWWALHSLWLNIWSVVIQLCLAALVLSFSSPLGTRLASIVAACYAVVVWVSAQAFGHVTSSVPSFLTYAPGSALLILLTCLPLITQTWALGTYFRYGLCGFWGVFFVFQWWPTNQFWSGAGFQSLAQAAYAVRLPGFLQGADTGVLTAFAHVGWIANLLIGLAACVLTIAWWRVRSRLGTLQVGTTVVLLLIWIFVQGIGLGGGFSLFLGTAPIIIVWVWFTRTRNFGPGGNNPELQ